jgi:hypothetical protein
MSKDITGCDGVEWIHLALDSEHNVEASVPTEGGEFLWWLRAQFNY